MKQFLVALAMTLFMCPMVSFAQELGHPRIYTTNAAKTKFLESIQTTEWKKNLVDKKIENLEKYLAYCEKDPKWLVSRLQMNWKTKHSKVFLKGGNFSHSEGKAPVPTVRFSGTRDWASDYKRPKLEDVEPYFDDPRGFFLENKEGIKEWVHPSKIGFTIEKINEQIIGLLEDAAFLYWVTGDEKYAAFAKPVFETYMEGMYYRDAPIDLENGTQQRVSGLATFEVIHEGILKGLATTYDFLYDYFKKEKVNIAHSDAVFQKWGDQIIVNGIPDNNWNLFQARFLTYVALVLDTDKAYRNGKGREYFLKYTFDTSTERQLSIDESLLVYDQETGMWPECATYSVHVIASLLDIFTLLDHFTNKNELSNYPIIEKAALASFQYLFPSGYMVGFGDSSHKPLPPENFELLISNYRKYNNTEKEAIISGLLNDMIAKGEYKRKADGLFELFFYVDDLKESNEAQDGLSKLTSPTFYASNVSMFNQRLGKGNDAMMVSLAGSYGNHSHVNGISMELFANNYVLGPDMGKGPSYWHTDHRDFYSRFPAHNTVVVDGKSDYNAMRGYHPFALDNHFPKAGTIPQFDKLTFSKVSFFEPATQANQQRFTAIVKGKNSKGYIVDVFRSKKQKEGKQRHDYIYRNLGQSLELLDAKTPLNVTETTDFGSKQGDLKAYNYLTNKKKVETSKDVQALFRLKSKNEADNIMKVWVKGSEQQSIYTALSPKSNAITKGSAPAEVVDNPMETLIVKREEAAWENPFAMVFNPYIDGEENPVSNVTFSTFKENPSTQVVEVLLSDNKTTDKIILNSNEGDIIKTDNLYQQGVVSITRKAKGSNAIDYVFLSGIYNYQQDGWSIVASGKPVTLSIERSKNTFVIESDAPVVIRAPFLDGKKSAELQVYENGKLIAARQGQINRSNPEQLEFRLMKARSKVVIVY
ncbi:heparinase II/III family protein [Mariniflexile gromovii]|uniref:Heparinase II/III family protein n=1 Tax=Mariniflexile gromovii TaxID=362523 RepID=A0ABS4BV30_9FLAO|nr:heparinase II/III family protein [Mariniflexile gromovii]MBP0903866.1 heparinase II/III family protein [Mariniflexile gromovii]